MPVSKEETRSVGDLKTSEEDEVKEEKEEMSVFLSKIWLGHLERGWLEFQFFGKRKRFLVQLAKILLEKLLNDGKIKTPYVR